MVWMLRLISWSRVEQRTGVQTLSTVATLSLMLKVQAAWSDWNVLRVYDTSELKERTERMRRWIALECGTTWTETTHRTARTSFATVGRGQATWYKQRCREGLDWLWWKLMLLFFLRIFMITITIEIDLIEISTTHIIVTIEGGMLAFLFHQATFFAKVMVTSFLFLTSESHWINSCHVMRLLMKSALYCVIFFA